MSILQPAQLELHREELERIAGKVEFLPQLSSEDASLHHQSAKDALARKLGDREQVVVDGAAGSGKTVLALSLAVTAETCAYLHAGRWLPQPNHGLREVLLNSGCDVEKAMDAYKAGSLRLVIDAVDEFPWVDGGRSVPAVLERLSEELHGKAGFLVTSRTRNQVPSLPHVTCFASLSGIARQDLEQFLRFYAGSASGVAELAERIADLAVPDELKYSPLVLRFLAENLTLGEIPSNPVALYEKMIDFYVTRECGKAPEPMVSSYPESWQARYADVARHTSLVSTLVFSSGKSAQNIAEPELLGTIREVLQPTASSLDAHATVELATLMSQHPLVTVTYLGEAMYRVECRHDWVRAGLLPEFLTEKSIGSQIRTLEEWHKALPNVEDYITAWELPEARLKENINTLLELSATPEQAMWVAKWLSFQAFSPKIDRQAIPVLLKAIAQLACMFCPPEGDLSKLLELDDVLRTPAILKQQSLEFPDDKMVPNFGDLTVEDSIVIIGGRGHVSACLRRCDLRGVHIRVLGGSLLKLDACFLSNVTIDADPEAKVELNMCVYDSSSCAIPGVPNVILSACTDEPIEARSRDCRVLAQVLRKLVVVGSTVEMTKPRTNVNAEYVYRSVEERHRAQRVIEIMKQREYVDLKPTGSVRRVDPTTKFSARDAGQFISTPVPSGTGPMTRMIMRDLRK